MVTKPETKTAPTSAAVVAAAGGGGGGKYVPPNQRGAERSRGGESMGTRMNRDGKNVLK